MLFVLCSQLQVLSEMSSGHVIGMRDGRYYSFEPSLAESTLAKIKGIVTGTPVPLKHVVFYADFEARLDRLINYCQTLQRTVDYLWSVSKPVFLSEKDAKDSLDKLFGNRLPLLNNQSLSQLIWIVETGLRQGVKGLIKYKIHYATQTDFCKTIDVALIGKIRQFIKTVTKDVGKALWNEYMPQSDIFDYANQPHFDRKEQPLPMPLPFESCVRKEQPTTTISPSSPHSSSPNTASTTIPPPPPLVLPFPQPQATASSVDVRV